MKEKDIQSIFHEKNTIEGAFELKLCKGKSIRWDAVKQHQIDALSKISGPPGLYHKIADQPVSATTGTRFTKKKPFDCFFFRNRPAYVVICWYVPRVRKTMYYIDINEYLANYMANGKKSFTEFEAIEMARKNGHIFHF